MGNELVQHGKLGSGYIHKVTNWVFQDTASRNSLANQFTILDVDKVCKDLETGKYYMLKSVHPTSGAPTWYELAENVGAGEANTISSVGAGVSLIASPSKVGVDLRTKSLVQGANIILTLDASTITIAASLPAGATITEVELDFGSKFVRDKVFTITNAFVTPTSKITMVPSGNIAAGRIGNDWNWDTVSIACKPGTGNFTATAFASGKIKGKRKFIYTF